MISEIRKKKYLYTFETFFDLDKNGVIDIRDIAILIDKLCRFKGWKAGSPKYVETQKIFYQIFDEMLEQVKIGKCDGINKDLWIELWDTYKNNPSMEFKWKNEIENFSFTFIKDPKSNSWVAKSVATLFVEFGLDENEAKRAFKKASLGKEEISAEVFAVLYDQFYTSDDPNAPGNFLLGKESF